jgi:hypothetical protein
MIENRSTNTAENIAFTQKMLLRDDARNALEQGIKSVLVVASPSRLRRVKLTLQFMHPGLEVRRCLPALNFDRERALYETKGIDYLLHLLGELDRIVEYAERGWIDEFGSVRANLKNDADSIYFRGTETINVTRDSRWIGQNSFYVEHGDWFVGVCVVLAALGFAALRFAPPETATRAEVG